MLITKPDNELAKCFKADGPYGLSENLFKGMIDFRFRFHQATFSDAVLESVLDSIEGFKEKLRKYSCTLAQQTKYTCTLYVVSEAGISVCDAGCSTAVQTIMMARKFPNSTFFAFDVSSDAVRQASTRAQQQGGVANLTFGVADGCDMPRDWSERFDVLVTWDVVHDVPHSSRFLREIRRVLKPGGMFLMIDINTKSDVADNIGNDSAIGVYGYSLFHCLPTAMADKHSEGLGAAWGVEMQKEYLQRTGFISTKQVYPRLDDTRSYFVSYNPTE